MIKKLRFGWVAPLALAIATGGAGAAGASEGSGGPAMRVHDRDAQGIPTWVSGKLGTLPAGERGAAAAGFLKTFARQHLRATGREELVATKVHKDETGHYHIRVQERLRGLPVIGADLALQVDAETGEVEVVNGRFFPDQGLPLRPLLAGEEAIEKASFEIGIDRGEALEEPELVYVVGALGDRAYLAWSAPVRYQVDGREKIDRLFADAVTGKLVANHPLIHEALSRRVYTANNGTSLPGTLLISEGGSSSDSAAQTVYNNMGTTWNYYWYRHGRDSVDNAGLILKSTIRYNFNECNARWHPSQKQASFGDGCGHVGNALDVVAHELTHGVTQHESNLTYSNESGAVNESLSDIMGAAVEAYADGGANANTWKVGEDLSYTFRYMNDPAAFSHTDFYPDRYPTVATPSDANDYGYVHSNSGLANLAFYLVSQGGAHPRGKTTYSVPGIGIDKAAAIFYNANRDHLVSFAGYIALQSATEQAAKNLYGTTSAEVKTVEAAWCAVGMPLCLKVNMSGPYSAVCTSQPVTVSASPSLKGNCPNSGCSYSWSYRWCENTTVPNACPSTFYPLSGTGSSITQTIRSYDKYLEFKATLTCNTTCGRNGQLTGSETFKVWGPASPDCGGGGGGGPL